MDAFKARSRESREQMRLDFQIWCFEQFLSLTKSSSISAVRNNRRANLFCGCPLHPLSDAMPYKCHSCAEYHMAHEDDNLGLLFQQLHNLLKQSSNYKEWHIHIGTKLVICRFGFWFPVHKNTEAPWAHWVAMMQSRAALIHLGLISWQNMMPNADIPLARCIFAL